MNALLERAGIRPDQAPRWLAAQLAMSHLPFTALLDGLFGLHIIPALHSGPCHGRLDASQAALLFAPEGTRCRWRTSTLYAGRLTVAGAWLLWLPARTGPQADDELGQAARPAGSVLAELLPGGMRREAAAALEAAGGPDEITGHPVTVTARATLVSGRGLPVALVQENIVAPFTGWLAGVP